MITRVWHGRTRTEDAGAYREYVIATGVGEYQNTPGNLGVQIWQKQEGDVTHIWTVTTWKDLDAVKAFAGSEVEKAKYYPEDRKYLLEFEPAVAHYECYSFPGFSSK